MAEERIDLNEASAEALDRLPGIGPVLARRIVEHRETFGPFERAEDLTSVAGIGENSVRRLADHLLAPASPEPAAGGDDGSDEPASQPSASAARSEAELEEDASTNAQDLQKDGGSAPNQERPEIEAVPPGESLAEEGTELGPEDNALLADESELDEGAVPAQGEPEDGGIPTEASFSEGGLPEEKVGAEGAAAYTSDQRRGLGAEHEPRGEGGEREETLPPSSVGSPAEMKPAPPWWRQLSWVWTAILGGLLGMVFALIVFAGINGSLDVGHSRAVLDIEGDLRGLTRDVDALQADVDTIRTRLDALEGLTERMDSVESAVDDLTDQANDLADRADVLEEDVAGLSDDLQALSQDVSELQNQAEQTRSFFVGLQTLLQDIFGEVEGPPTVAPTPTPEGK
jgi:competence ComEA-like helix-hairpin-helix protein